MTKVDSLNPIYCTGCGVCKNVCPVNAIQMIANEEGFLHPVIKDNCIDCGLCANKCPQLTGKFNYNPEPGMIYAAWCKDEFREKGSSGGVFPALATYIIKKGGMVFGAAFNDDFRGVSIVGVDNVNHLPKLFKSKYVQSRSPRSLFRLPMPG